MEEVESKAKDADEAELEVFEMPEEKITLELHLSIKDYVMT